MNDPERHGYLVLLVLAAIGTVISMVAGPLNHTAVATGAAGSAILFTALLVLYTLWSWPKER